MSAICQTAPIWGIASYGRMSSVEELDSSLTLLSKHTVLSARPLPLTPPGTPLVARSPEQSTSTEFEYVPESPIGVGGQGRIPPNTPVTPSMMPLQVSTSECWRSKCSASTASAPALANGAPQTPFVAAIDNKIEQAMDLVKTHLTFAVREEVENMKTTITDLEARVAFLENENQLLRSYAPANVVENLQQMVQNKKANSAPPASSVAPSLPPPKVPAGFCSTIFANTLNNVVAEVSREISGQTPPQ